MSRQLAKTIADAVLWEGYLLYPYRADSAKNQIRWQFGVLGPPHPSRSGIAEESGMHCECLVQPAGAPTVDIELRFLRLVRRQILRCEGDDLLPVAELRVDGATLLSFEEACDCELAFGPLPMSGPAERIGFPISLPATSEAEDVIDAQGVRVGRTIRSSAALTGSLTVDVGTVGRGLRKLACTVDNQHPGQVDDRDAATAVSFLGAHLLMEVGDGAFVSLLEPASEFAGFAAQCRQSRCWPVLTGSPGDTDVVLASPIILYDYPAVAPESAGALFDSTEIDEILTLRVMTLTDEEKAAARATDPAAAAIIDRCESMSPQDLARLHGALRDPRADIPTFATPPDDTAPWWDPAVDESVSPTTDSVLVHGRRVSKGSLVRICPRRRADAQDLFYAGQSARVTSVFTDVDDNTHVAVVLLDDPAADLHEWYGRYLYYAPDELEPLGEDLEDQSLSTIKENRP